MIHNKKILSGVYRITNTINGKVYIGSAINIKRRWHEHNNALQKDKHWNQHLQSSWNKYGQEIFEFRILIHCNIDKLIWYEQRMIDLYSKRFSWENLYNQCPIAGSQLGYKFSKDSREKMSQTRKGKPGTWIGRHHTEETKRLLSEKNKGKKLSSETCLKMSNSTKGKIISDETKKKLSVINTGKKHTLETRKKISDAQIGREEPHLGKKCSKESKKRMSESHKGHNHSQEQKDKISRSLKGIKRSPETCKKVSEAVKEVWRKRNESR